MGENLDKHFASPEKSSENRAVAGPRPWLILTLAVPGLILLPFAIAASILGVRYRRLVERDTIPESPAARIGMILGAAGILLGMIQVCAFIYLLPYLVTTVEPALDAQAAFSALQKIHAIQSDYKQLTGAYASNLEMLEKRGFIDSSFRNLRNYRLELISSRVNGFEGRAIALEPGDLSFYIDQTGIIRSSAGADVGPDSNVMRRIQETTR